jgi:hypothetical protein
VQETACTQCQDAAAAGGVGRRQRQVSRHGPVARDRCLRKPLAGGERDGARQRAAGERQVVVGVREERVDARVVVVAARDGRRGAAAGKQRAERRARQRQPRAGRVRGACAGLRRAVRELEPARRALDRAGDAETLRRRAGPDADVAGWVDAHPFGPGAAPERRRRELEVGAVGLVGPVLGRLEHQLAAARAEGRRAVAAHREAAEDVVRLDRRGRAGRAPRGTVDDRQGAERAAVDVEVRGRRRGGLHVEGRGRFQRVDADTARGRLVDHRVAKCRRVGEHPDEVGRAGPACRAEAALRRRRACRARAAKWRRRAARDPGRQHPPVHVREAIRADAGLLAGKHEGRERLAANRLRVSRLERVGDAGQQYAGRRLLAVHAHLHPAGGARGEQLARDPLRERRAQQHAVPPAGVHRHGLRLAPQRFAARPLRRTARTSRAPALPQPRVCRQTGRALARTRARLVPVVARSPAAQNRAGRAMTDIVRITDLRDGFPPTAVRGGTPGRPGG